MPVRVSAYTSDWYDANGGLWLGAPNSRKLMTGDPITNFGTNTISGITDDMRHAYQSEWWAYPPGMEVNLEVPNDKILLVTIHTAEIAQ